MVHHLVLFKLNPDVTDDDVEKIMREVRIRLLKISVVLAVRCGKRISEDNEWPIFLSCDFESMEKLAMYLEDPVHLKFVQEVIEPNVSEYVALDFELDPGRDVRYS